MQIQVGSGEVLRATQKGNISIKDDVTGNDLRIQAVQIPGFTKNIISVKKLNQAGFKVEFDGMEATIVHKATGSTAFICRQGQDGMHYLSVKAKEEAHPTTTDSTAKKPVPSPDTTVPTQEDAAKMKTPLVMSLNDAHDRLGHMGKTLLLKTCKQHGQVRLLGLLWRIRPVIGHTF
jgi:hypothetical protein